MTVVELGFPELRPLQTPDQPPVQAPLEHHLRRRTVLFASILIAALVAALCVDQILRSGYFTIEQVRVDTVLQRVDQGLIERSTWRNIKGNYLTADLGGIEQALENLPGVYQAVIRRVWPQTLAVSVTETGAMAQFAPLGKSGTARDHEFINLRPSNQLSTVPVLRAHPVDRQMIIDVFKQILPALHDVELEPLALSVSPAGRWELELQTGVDTPANRFVLLAGRGPVREKVIRFASSYAMALRSRGDMIAKVDMRYVNGFAVRWRDDSAVNQVQLAGLTEGGD